MRFWRGTVILDQEDTENWINKIKQTTAVTAYSCELI